VLRAIETSSHGIDAYTKKKEPRDNSDGQDHFVKSTRISGHIAGSLSRETQGMDFSRQYRRKEDSPEKRIMATA
jgi:hypothetical protein